MKIFYAVQATGNGHISRAIALMPYLQKLGEVDVFLSGANATLNPQLPIKFKSKGLSLYYSTCGGLNYKKMWQQNSLYRAIKEAKQLPIEQYDLILNDFDFITSKACQIKQLPSIQFGHQASFVSNNTPRPETKSIVGEWILKNYAQSTHNIGLHFKPYADFILPPVVKPYFLQSRPTNKGHITVYLPAYQQNCLEHHFKKLTDVHFHWFLHGIQQIERIDNITYHPISNDLFNESMLHCHGIITGGGFETPAEALYLNKHLMAIPIRGQYEQNCNAAALKAIGVTVLPDAEVDNFADLIQNWLNQPTLNYTQQVNDIDATMQYIRQLWESSIRKKAA